MPLIHHQVSLMNLLTHDIHSALVIATAFLLSSICFSQVSKSWKWLFVSPGVAVLVVIYVVELSGKILDGVGAGIFLILVALIVLSSAIWVFLIKVAWVHIIREIFNWKTPPFITYCLILFPVVLFINSAVSNSTSRKSSCFRDHVKLRLHSKLIHLPIRLNASLLPLNKDLTSGKYLTYELGGHAKNRDKICKLTSNGNPPLSIQSVLFFKRHLQRETCRQKSHQFLPLCTLLKKPVFENISSLSLMKPSTFQRKTKYQLRYATRSNTLSVENFGELYCHPRRDRIQKQGCRYFHKLDSGILAVINLPTLRNTDIKDLKPLDVLLESFARTFVN